MAGSRSFSSEAASVLVEAYLAQPEDGRDLRKILAAAKQYTSGDKAAFHFFRFLDADTLDVRSVLAEIAGMSKSQAYELLRQDPRYQGPSLSESEQLALEKAQAEIEYQSGLTKPDLKRLRDAHKIVTQSQWKDDMLRRRQAKDPEANGLAGLVA